MDNEATLEVELSNGLIATIDAADAAPVAPFRWYCSVSGSGKTFYAAARIRADGKQTTLYMHRLITGCQRGDGKDVDHKDGNGLNNRKNNLRVCTRQQNQCNRDSTNPTGFRGVALMKGGRVKPWVAGLKYRGRRLVFGYYATAEEAARAYDDAAKRLNGEFARLNFPDG
jgi:hypothetical protein